MSAVRANKAPRNARNAVISVSRPRAHVRRGIWNRYRCIRLDLAWTGGSAREYSRCAARALRSRHAPGSGTDRAASASPGPRRKTTGRRGRSSSCAWWPETDLNRRHGDFQSPALPSELPGLVVLKESTQRSRVNQATAGCSAGRPATGGAARQRRQITVTVAAGYPHPGVEHISYVCSVVPRG